MLPCKCAGNPRKCETWPFIYRNKISAGRDDGANDVYDDDKDNGSSGGAVMTLIKILMRRRRRTATGVMGEGDGHSKCFYSCDIDYINANDDDVMMVIAAAAVYLLRAGDASSSHQ